MIQEVPLDRLIVQDAPTPPSGLIRSIARFGVLQPVIVRPLGRGLYEVVQGRRRVMAARKAGLTTVPAIVQEMDDAQARDRSLHENLHRGENLVHLARALRAKRAEFPGTQETGADLETWLARELAVPVSRVREGLALADLPDAFIQAHAEGRLGRAALRLLARHPEVWDEVMNLLEERTRAEKPRERRVTTRDIHDLILARRQVSTQQVLQGLDLEAFAVPAPRPAARCRWSVETTDCGHEAHPWPLPQGWRFCPYCGRRITVVEEVTYV